VIAAHFATARELSLVLAEPHVTVRMREGDKTAPVDIFTWRDSSIPDHAPPAILATWAEMARLTEPRAGKPAVDIVPVALVRRSPGLNLSHGSVEIWVSRIKTT
jgi:hypothetical protein